MKNFYQLLVLLTMFAFTIANAQPQSKISWQGVLQDAQGANLDGTYNITVKLFDAATAGTMLWSETFNDFEVSDGYVNLMLGSINELNLTFDSQYWLEITIDVGTPLSRVMLTAVPYAMFAISAETILETDPTWSGDATETSSIGRTGNVGIGTTNPTALLHTNGTGTGGGNVLFVGEEKSEPGDPPVSGAGTRLMWYPDKAAFRAGRVTETQWDKDNIGYYSVSFGLNTKAKGHGSFATGRDCISEGHYSFSSGWDNYSNGWASTAMGRSTIAEGDYSTAMGFNTIAEGYTATAMGGYTTAFGDYSTAMGWFSTADGMASTAIGYLTTASGDYSTAMGSRTIAVGDVSTTMGESTTAEGSVSTAIGMSTTAVGDYSTAIGRNTTAHSYAETVVGQWNTEYTPNSITEWDEIDRLFVIGNGTESYFLSDAMVVLKNGNIGIGISSPTTKLDIDGEIRIRGGNPGTGKVLTSNAAGTGTWENIESLPSGSNEQSLRHDGSNWIANDFLTNSGSNIGINTSPQLNHRLSVHSGTGNVGNGKTAIYGHRSGMSGAENGGASWNSGLIDAAIKGYSYWGNSFSAGVAGYSDLDYINSAALIGSNNDGTVRGVIGYKDEESRLWAGHFTGNVNVIGRLAAGINTNPSAMLHISNQGTDPGNVLFAGVVSSSPGNPPAIGAGTRMMWYPEKSAFRVGRVTGTQWDKDNIGYYSIALGYNPVALNSVSTAIGDNVTAYSAYETVVGRFNKAYTPAQPSGWGLTDRLFVIANGTWDENRHHALTVLKNGKSGFGTNATQPSLLISIGDNNTGIDRPVSNTLTFHTNNSERMRISTEGRVGIGTSSPESLFHLNHSTGSAVLRISSNSTSESEIRLASGTTSALIRYNNTSNYLYIYSNGYVNFYNGRIGFGSALYNPTFALHLPNTSSDAAGRGRANAWTTYSDSRIKSNKDNLSYGIKEIMQLKPVKYFQHNSSFEDGKLVISNEGANDIGFIAQDIYKIIPEIVNVPEDENSDLWGMNYEKLTPVLVKALQEQQGIINNQNKRIEELEARFEQLLQSMSQTK